jgi:hypothetical protein
MTEQPQLPGEAALKAWAELYTTALANTQLLLEFTGADPVIFSEMALEKHRELFPDEFTETVLLQALCCNARQGRIPRSDRAYDHDKDWLRRIHDCLAYFQRIREISPLIPFSFRAVRLVTRPDLEERWCDLPQFPGVCLRLEQHLQRHLRGKQDIRAAQDEAQIVQPDDFMVVIEFLKELPHLIVEFERVLTYMSQTCRMDDQRMQEHLHGVSQDLVFIRRQTQALIDFFYSKQRGRRKKQ